MSIAWCVLNYRSSWQLLNPGHRSDATVADQVRTSHCRHRASFWVGFSVSVSSSRLLMFDSRRQQPERASSARSLAERRQTARHTDFCQLRRRVVTESSLDLFSVYLQTAFISTSWHEFKYSVVIAGKQTWNSIDARFSLLWATTSWTTTKITALWVFHLFVPHFVLTLMNWKSRLEMLA